GRRALGQDLALDLGREVHLALQTLLLQRLQVEPRVLQRQRRLVGEERERAPVRRQEGTDAAAALLVTHRDQTARTALDLDRHAQQVEGAGQQVGRRGSAAGEELVQLRIVEGKPGRRLAAERAVQAVAAVLQDVESAAPRVEQRDSLQQDQLGEPVEIQGRGHREAHVVEGLQLDHPVVHLELLLFQVLPQPAALERGGEEHGQRVARRGAGLVGAASLARRVEEPPAGERQAAVTPGRAARLEEIRQAVAHGGLALQQVPLLEVEAGGGGAALLAPEVEQPLQELALVRVVAGEGQQLVPGLDDHAGRRGALHFASRIQS